MIPDRKSFIRPLIPSKWYKISICLKFNLFPMCSHNLIYIGLCLPFFFLSPFPSLPPFLSLLFFLSLLLFSDFEFLKRIHQHRTVWESSGSPAVSFHTHYYAVSFLKTSVYICRNKKIRKHGRRSEAEGGTSPSSKWNGWARQALLIFISQWAPSVVETADDWRRDVWMCHLFFLPITFTLLCASSVVITIWGQPTDGAPPHFVATAPETGKLARGHAVCVCVISVLSKLLASVYECSCFYFFAYCGSLFSASITWSLLS